MFQVSFIPSLLGVNVLGATGVFKTIIVVSADAEHPLDVVTVSVYFVSTLGLKTGLSLVGSLTPMVGDHW